MKNLIILLTFAFIPPHLFGQQETAASINSDVTTRGRIVVGSRSVTTKKAEAFIPAAKSREVGIPEVSSTITIDGRPNEEAWKSAAVFRDFYQTSPGDNTAPTYQTEAYLTYDENNLYIAFKCWDDPAKIRVTVAKRDGIFGEDNVRIWLDTYNDRRRAYVLAFNPFGIQQDGIYTEGQGTDFLVDVVMESRGAIEDWGWSVEAKIPFSSLRYTAGKDTQWGFNAARSIPRLNGELNQWLPDDRNVSGVLIKHGKISGLDEIKFERTLEVIPSITMSQVGVRKRTLPAGSGGYHPIFYPIGAQDPGRFVNLPIQGDFGMSLKYTLSPNITLDAAFNPDFAEIEADSPVITANNRFPIFLEEKRPVFLEGKDIFDTPLQSFYSRNIVDPDAAAKLTGKTGGTSFGLLFATDNSPGDYSEDERNELALCQLARTTDPGQSCPIEEFVDENALFGVARVKKDLGAENSIGFFAAARTFPRNRNFTSGFDGVFKLDPQTVMTFQVLGTHSRKYFYDPIEDLNSYRTGNGFGYSLRFDHNTDTHGWSADAIGRSSDYRADAGFTHRTDTNAVSFSNRFSTTSEPEATLIRASWSQFGRYVFDWSGRTQGGLVGNHLHFHFNGNLFVSSEAGLMFERIYEDEFGPARSDSLSGAFYGDPTRSAAQPYLLVNVNKTVNDKIFLYGSLNTVANAFDYDFGAGNRYPRTSPAFTNYLSGPEFTEYLRQLSIYQSNPTSVPVPILPGPPPLDPGPGFQLSPNIGGEYKPIGQFRISLDYTKSRLTRNDNDQVAFDTNIFSLRSTYQFSRFVYTRMRMDYDSLPGNTTGQFLFGWNPNPGTAFSAGYNDNFNYRGYSPFTNQFEHGFERNQRTFFVRASYLFRKSFR
ncbi:MAG: DUF5916 domain-containing protein [Pyrinomonadaceae bacterium]